MTFNKCDKKVDLKGNNDKLMHSFPSPSTMNCSKETLNSVSEYCFKAWSSENLDDPECSLKIIQGTSQGIPTILSVSLGILGNLFIISSLLYCVRKKK